MRDVFDWLSTPWVGTVLAIVSLAAAFYFYRKSRRVSLLVYQRYETALVGSAVAAFPDELEIRFGGTTVPRVTATQLILWNAGNTTINGDQIVEADPLRFAFPAECQVLRATIDKLSRPANSVVLRSDGNVVMVSFDYLDPQDGVSLTIYHSAGRQQVVGCGTLRGLLGGPLYWGVIPQERERRMRRSAPLRISMRTMIVVMTTFGVGLSSFGFFYDTLNHSPLFNRRVMDSRWFFGGLGLLYLTMPALLVWSRRRRSPKVLDF